jgi:hypothetical protein
MLFQILLHGNTPVWNGPLDPWQANRVKKYVTNP